MKIYYGLTEKEAKLKFLKYSDNKNYNCKGVNTSLSGLEDFIRDNKMNDLIKYYTILDSDIFEIDKDIIFDKKYDMIAVRIPFEFEIKNVYILDNKE